MALVVGFCLLLFLGVLFARDPEHFLPLLGSIAVLAAVLWASVRLGRSVLVRIRWNRPVAFLSEPVEDRWAQIVDDTFPLSRTLTAEQRERLLKYVQLFLHEKRFEGCNGLVVTEEMRVSIAAQACFLLLGLEGGCYPGLDTIVLYPSTYIPREDWAYKLRMRTGQIADKIQPRLGESWVHGTIVLSWDAVRHGAVNIQDGKNVVFHEFAHQLDQADGVADGVPAAWMRSSLHVWAELIGKHRERLKRARKKFRRTVLRKYGATNRAEFFAVATEAFFEKPHQLKKKVPDLYDELAVFFRRNPIEERASNVVQGSAVHDARKPNS